MASFDQAITTVLQHEGGYVNDPNDAGGETNFGISKRSYPLLNIHHLSVNDAKSLYHRDFWVPLLLDVVSNQSIATKILDTAVLTGKLRAVKFAQQAAQQTGEPVVVDGMMGLQTLGAINSAAPVAFLSTFKHLLAAYFEGLVQAVPTDAKFLNGWKARAYA